MMSSRIQPLLFDEHAALHVGVNWIFSNTEDLELSAEARDVSEAEVLPQKRRFDIVVLGLNTSGASCLEMIKSKALESRVLIYTSICQFASLKFFGGSALGNA